MKNQRDDWKEILLYLFKNQNSSPNVTEVRRKTQIHTKHFADYKVEMEKKGLIKVEIRGGKMGERNLGRSHYLSITPKGVKWLILNLNSSLQKILGPLSQNLNQLTHETDVKDRFRKDLLGLTRRDFALARKDARELFEPLGELLRNIIILQLWLQPNYHPLAGVAPWMQLSKSEPSKAEISLNDAKEIVKSNYFFFCLNMEGYIPIPPLPPDNQMTVAYLQNSWKFSEELSEPKDGPLPLSPLKGPINKAKNGGSENA